MSRSNRGARQYRQPQPKKCNREPRFEQMEDRRLMALAPASFGSEIVLDASRGDGLFAAGSITYNPTYKYVTIEGTEQYNDRVNITYDTRGTATQTDDQIRSFLIERYGDFVLYRPPVKGNTLVLWLAPLLLLLGGAVFVGVSVSRRKHLLPASTGEEDS